MSTRAAATTLALGAALVTGTLVTGAAAIAVTPGMPTSTDDLPVPDDVSVTGESCGEQDGVDVVVDFPAVEGVSDEDSAGEIQLGCAPEVGGSGTEALNAAGFTDTRDSASMICAVASFPDPCPQTFEGVFWSYWFADAEGESAGEWQQHLEGPDTTVTQAGRVEGWRYGDGSEGPRVDAAHLLGIARDPGANGDGDGGATADPTPTAEETPDEAATEGETEEPATDADATDESGESGESAGVPAWVWFAGGLVVLALLVLAVNAVRRPADGPRGQD